MKLTRFAFFPSLMLSILFTSCSNFKNKRYPQYKIQITCSESPILFPTSQISKTINFNISILSNEKTILPIWELEYYLDEDLIGKEEINSINSEHFVNLSLDRAYKQLTINVTMGNGQYENICIPINYLSNHKISESTMQTDYAWSPFINQ